MHIYPRITAYNKDTVSLLSLTEQKGKNFLTYVNFAVSIDLGYRHCNGLALALS